MYMHSSDDAPVLVPMWFIRSAFYPYVAMEIPTIILLVRAVTHALPAHVFQYTVDNHPCFELVLPWKTVLCTRAESFYLPAMTKLVAV